MCHEKTRLGSMKQTHVKHCDILSESERQDVLTAVQSVSATGFASGKEMLTKLSGLAFFAVGIYINNFHLLMLYDCCFKQFKFSIVTGGFVPT
mgnify:CR=1 FL=1